jgi:uncharacterized repeat protein (TIGR01451 family)
MGDALKNRIALYLLLAVFPIKAGAQQSTSIALGVVAESNPSTLSAPVTLMATLSPPTATGKVTFYDGTAIIGVAGLNLGRASFTTRLLPSGIRTLQARYWGDPGFSPSVSEVVRQTVNAKAGLHYNHAPDSPFLLENSATFASAADFNGDGRLDLVISNYTGDGTTVLLNDGNGGFAAAPGSPFAIGIQASAIAVGDFNGDGKPDLAIPDSLKQNVTIWLGDGAGGFAATAEPFETGKPDGIVVADFNGDGRPDVAVANRYNDTVTVLLGDGRGGFQSPGRTFGVGSLPTKLSAADFNTDGNADLAVANFLDDSVTVLLGDGSGGFTPAGQPLPIRISFSVCLAVEDLNGDGSQDLVVTDENYENGIVVWLGDGRGGFTPAQGSPFSAGNSPASVAVGDFNGDGRPDLAVGNTGGNDVIILLGKWSDDSLPRFQGFVESASGPLPAGGSPQAVVAGDFDGNGMFDVATANGGSGNNVGLLLAGSLGLAITQAQKAPFLLNETGTYLLTVTNKTGAGVAGQVKVVDLLPPGLVPTAWGGTGWDCAVAGPAVTCVRADPVAAGQDYPPIDLTVRIAPAACPSAQALFSSGMEPGTRGATAGLVFQRRNLPAADRD